MSESAAKEALRLASEAGLGAIAEFEPNLQIIERLITIARQRPGWVQDVPEVDDFMRGVPLEAAHQRERWGVDHDAGKTPADWFWLIGYVAGKALHAAISGNSEKFKHHVITTAAVCANWHLYATGADTRMRPGIATPEASSHEQSAPGGSSA
jgi:hypothetical protein